MKKCIVCKQIKPLLAFRLRATSLDGRQTKCKQCAREYDRQLYINNSKRRQSIKDNNKRTQNLNREKIALYLSQNPCVDCGETNIIKLDFDHKNSESKMFNISSMMKLYSWKKVKKEIDKCEIRCANCHRVKTAHQQNNWKLRYLEKCCK